MRIGFMQGRLSPLVDGRIQAFPWLHWRKEFGAAHQLGLDLMEWTLDHDRLTENPLMTERGRAEIMQLVGDHGLTIASLTCDFAMQAPFYKETGPIRGQRLAQLRAVIEAGAEVGIGLVVVPLVDNGRLEDEGQEHALREGVHSLLGTLRDARCAIVFESDFPPARLAQFIAGYDDALFGINYDTGNSAALGFDPDDEIAAYGARIRNVHVKDRLMGGTTVPLGTGNADLPRSFRALRESGYDGNLVLQTARAADGDHAGALARYRQLVERAWQEAAVAARA